MARKFFTKLGRNEADTGTYLERARASLARGDLPRAAEDFNRVLQADPGHREALSSIASIAMQGGEPATAVNAYTAIIEQQTHSAELYFKRGNAFLAQGRLDQALADFDRATTLQLDYGHAWCNRGVVLDRLGHHAAALESLERALRLNPSDTVAAINVASLLGRLRRTDEAVAYLDRALQRHPANADMHFMQGVLWHGLGRFELAVRSFDAVVRHAVSAATLSAGHANRGAALAALGHLADAVTSYGQAIEQAPLDIGLYLQRAALWQALSRFEHAVDDYSTVLDRDPESLSGRLGLGRALRHQRKLEVALDCYKRVLGQDSVCLEAHVQQGNLLLELGRLHEATASFDAALRFDAGSVEALQGRAFALMRDRPEAAIGDLDRVLAINPQQRYIAGMRSHLKMQICDWAGFYANLAVIVEGLEARCATCIPHALLALVDSPRMQQTAAEIWVAEQFPSEVATAPAQATGQPRLRIGYFSPDFRDHPVARQAIELFESHDRTRFEVVAFSLGGEAQGPLRERLLAAFDRFIDVSEQSDEEVAQLSRTLGIDVAVDLGGHTEHCRTRIFALRAAPVQLSYLGYLGTLGAPYMDYLVADAVLIPEEARAHYAERIIYLPSYQVNDGKRRSAVGELSRPALGLPAEGFVYACFNSNYKITPDTFAAWMRILGRVAGSVLYLYVSSPIARQNLVAAAGAHGVAGERLVFGERLATEQYLARFRAMDLFLDTWPYNAGTTASDALWAGLPVLTYAGRSFAARMGSSLLQAVGLPELIAGSVSDYEERAVALAADPAHLEDLRQRLEAARATARLFDTYRFTRSLEQAFVELQSRRQAGLSPADLKIT